MTHILSDIFSLPQFGSGIFSIWYRNFLKFRRSLFINLFWIVIEPFVYLLALGFGVGSFINEIEGTTYIKYFAPALMTISGMFIAFFEGAYGCFSKLEKTDSYSTIMLSPICADEIAIGEIFWAASKGFFGVLVIGIICAATQLISPTFLLFVFIIQLLFCWVSAAFGVLLASKSTSYDSLIYAQSGLIIPMSLFSGTYFPLSSLPQGFEMVPYIFPLTHAVSATRYVLSGTIQSTIFLNLSVLFVFGFLLTNWAANSLQRRLMS